MNINQLFDMRGRRVLITGGGTGLGKAFARTLMQQGAHVMLAARREKTLQATVAELTSEFQESAATAAYVCLDVSSAATIEQAFQTIDEWGLVDVLINNAGVVNAKTMLELTEEEWDFVQDVNFKGVWLLTKAVVQRFIEQRPNADQDAAVINIASILGLSNLPGSSTYGASKAALLHLTKTMALEWAKYNIRANSISPGYINTDMAEGYIASKLGQRMLSQVPMRRFGNVEDVCGAALLLASPASRYMTASNIVVDGGHSIAKIV